MNSVREIIYSWHSGQWSAMYAFASSGIIEDLDALQIEISEISDADDHDTILDVLDDLQYGANGVLLAPWADEYLHSVWVDRLEVDLSLTTTQVCSIPSRGDCYDAVSMLCESEHCQHIKATLDPDVIRAELREYGAWDDEDLSGDDENFKRLIWIAASGMREHLMEYTK